MDRATNEDRRAAQEAARLAGRLANLVAAIRLVRARTVGASDLSLAAEQTVLDAEVRALRAQLGRVQTAPEMGRVAGALVVAAQALPTLWPLLADAMARQHEP